MATSLREAALREEEERALQAYLAERRREQAEIWSQIDDDRFAAVMDKKPELHYGQDFLKNKIIVPPFLVQPFFPSGGLAMLHGKRGIGKSMLAMTLTRCVATGEEFLGQFPVRRGTVVYIQLDMTDTVFQDRLLAAGDHYNVPDWYTLTGVANIGRATQNTDWVQKVVAAQPELIIIDTLRKAHSWAENDSDSAGRFYAKLRELFGFTAVLVIHHDRKSGEDSGLMPEGESFRGSGAWLDDIDAGLHFVKQKDGLWLKFSKTRTCDEIDAIPIAIEESSLSIKVRDDKLPKTSIARQRALAYLSKNPAADQQEVYRHLCSFDDLNKSQASKGATEVFKGR